MFCSQVIRERSTILRSGEGLSSNPRVIFFLKRCALTFSAVNPPASFFHDVRGELVDEQVCALHVRARSLHQLARAPQSHAFNERNPCNVLQEQSA